MPTSVFPMGRQEGDSRSSKQRYSQFSQQATPFPSASPHHSTPPSEWRPAQPLGDQATAPSPVRSPPGVARPISPPETPPLIPPRPSRLRRGGARGLYGKDTLAGLQLPAAPGTRPLGGALQGSELGGALALRLGNACNQSPGGSRRVLIGAGRSPPGPGQKPDP